MIPQSIALTITPRGHPLFVYGWVCYCVYVYVQECVYLCVDLYEYIGMCIYVCIGVYVYLCT